MTTTQPIAPPRGKYQGMLQILAFNWRLYLAAVVVLAAGVIGLSLLRMSFYWRVAAMLGLASTAFWILFSLAVSHWVYDRSGICEWAWIRDYFPEAPRRWANIHAGLDESTPTLAQLFSGMEGTVLDIFDPLEMTEASIAEARLQPTKSLPAIRVNFRTLPLADEALEAVFLIFAAHEIRRADSRLKFFGELRRVLKTSGRVLLVEHLRDWRNFLAYGPGCFHFHSRRTWLTAATQTGFVVEKESGITPFVRIFLLRKNL
jgi:hypothetical protein